MILHPRWLVISTAIGGLLGWLIKTDSDDRRAFLEAILIMVGIAVAVSMVYTNRWDFWRAF